MNISKIISLASILIFLNAGCRSNSALGQSDPKALFPILKNGKWGYINQQGKIVIEPKFEQATPFVEDLAPVRVDGKWGYIDTNGSFVIPPQYSAALHFSEGLGLVAWITGYETYRDPITPEKEKQERMQVEKFRNRGMAYGGYTNEVPTLEDDCFIGTPGLIPAARFGYIDKQGKVIWVQNDDYACKFHEGLAAVSTNSKAFYIDPSGKTVLQTSYQHADSFSEGLAMAQLDPASKWGFIDRSGQWVLPAQYDSTQRFREGAALVTIHSNAFKQAMTQSIEQAKAADSNNTGKPHIIAGVPVPMEPDSKFFIDKTGKKLDLPSLGGYDHSFIEGLSSIKGGYIDKSGAIAVHCPQDTTCSGSFSEGLAQIWARSDDGKSSKFGFIDRSGKIVIKPNFDSADDFHQGLALIRMGREMIVINGRAELNPELKIGYINSAGDFVWKPTN